MKKGHVDLNELATRVNLLPIAVCGMGSPSGRRQEMLYCGLKQNHSGEHAWAGLPTFVDGKTETEGEVEYLRSLNMTYGERLSRLSGLVLMASAHVGPPEDALNSGDYELFLELQAAANEIMSRPDWVLSAPGGEG